MKKMFAILALLGITGYAFGYDYGISNSTSTKLVVRLKEKALSAPTYKVIEPLSSAIFSFGGAYCLESIMYAPYNPAKANDLASHAFQSVEMYMEPKAVYEETVKGAKALAQGADDLGCKILEIAMKASPESAAKKEVGSTLSDIFGKGGSNSGGNKPATSKLDQLITDLNKAVKGTDGKYKTTPVASAIDLLNKNKTLLNDATFKKVEDQLKKGQNEDAITSLEVELLLESIAIDYDSNIYEDTNTYVDTSSSKKEKCQWGFGKLAKASGTLAGNTLCKAREFNLMSTGEKKKIQVGTKTVVSPYEEIIAVTTIGE
jgi:hypothetical protein